jgi:ribonuclease J
MLSLVELGSRCGRYPALLGRSLVTLSAAARAAKLWQTRVTLAEPGHLGYLPREEVLAIATGSQGEPGAALARLAADTHPALSLEPGDTVILSAKIIPGNEEAVNRLLERLRARQIEVIDADSAEVPVHASGHPCAGELSQMYRWLRPRLAVPVHGEDRHMQANAQVARDAGVPLALTGHNGDLFSLAPQPSVRRRAVQVGRLTVDDQGQLRPLR